MVFSGASDDKSGVVNGIFLFQGIKDDMPFYKNLVNQSYCYRANNGMWLVSDKESYEASKAAGWCSSVKTGCGHPSRALRWKVLVNGKFEEQPAVEVATIVIEENVLRFASSYVFDLSGDENMLFFLNSR